MLISITSSAESNFACAAVYPCDAEGNLLKEYSEPSECFDYYINQCLITKLQVTKANLQSCTLEKTGLESEIALELIQKNKKLKRKLKRARKALNQ